MKSDKELAKEVIEKILNKTFKNYWKLRKLQIN